MRIRKLLLTAAAAAACSSSLAAGIESIVRPFLVPAGADTIPAVVDVQKIPGAEWRPQEKGRADVWATKAVKGRRWLSVEVHGDLVAATRLHVEQFSKNGVNDGDYLNDKSLGRGSLKRLTMECEGTSGTVPAYQFTAPGFKPVYAVFGESFGSREGSSWVDLFHFQDDLKLHCETGR
jgi:hypothetical protein